MGELRREHLLWVTTKVQLVKSSSNLLRGQGR